MPVDVASAALLEMLYSDEAVLHLTGPKHVSWNDVFQPIAGKLGIPLVPAAEWLKNLTKSSRAANEAQLRTDKHDSAHALVDFFQTSLSNKAVSIATDKAVLASPSLARLGPPSEADVLKWLAYWENVGFLKATEGVSSSYPRL